MASAAAVATNLSQSPLPDHEQDDVLNTTATVLSADGRLEDEVDDDDDDVSRPARRRAAAPTNEGDGGDQDKVNGEDHDAEADLFGSGSEDGMSPKPRVLDDEELDSGDDEGRNDRAHEDMELAEDEAAPQQEEFTMEVDIGRHPVPEPSDGELYLLKVPRFLSIEPHAFNRETFQPPIRDHHSKSEASSTFSAYNTAQSTIRWRHSPSNPAQLQSNARVLRWSDGSLTLQLATEPQTQYTMPGNPLAPPQRNPRKPTPTSVKVDKRKNNRNMDTSYDPEKDTFTYLAAPNERSQIIRITNKFTTALKVEAAQNATHDNALERLQMQLAAATGNGMGDIDSAGMGSIHITEDPELAKKKAELAEKELVRAQRRRETVEQRDRERGGAPRAAIRRGAGVGGGLTIGGLEDDAEGGRTGSGRTPGGRQRAKPKRQGRRGEIYSDEEEEYGRRVRTREDEYDEEDDFVAGSDEEEEVAESEGDEDEGITLDSVGAAKANGVSSPKRDRDVDAEGDVDEEVGGDGASGAAVGRDRARASSPVGRGPKRRRVIEEDDDE